MGNGAEWVQCGCGQWIHEDCIGDSTVVGSDGTERILLQLCLVKHYNCFILLYCVIFSM